MMESFARLENSISEEQAEKLLTDWLFLPPVLCLVYLGVVYVGRRWMRYRKPYSLRRQLAVWNAALALFSIVGFTKLTPLLIRKLSNEGFVSSVCSDMKSSNQEIFWLTIFTFSKVVEFGDTLFIVLRKSPLLFLHWYHHVTVCLFTWYGAAAQLTDSTGHWFSWMNFGVHSAMYSYYLVKSTGVRLPRVMSTFVTLLQLVQFAVGLTCVLIAWWALHHGQPCYTSVFFNRLGLLLYGSYLLLFARFFYKRYLS